MCLTISYTHMLYFLHITIMLHTFSSIKQTLDTHLLLIGAISSVNKKIYDKKLCYDLFEVSTTSDADDQNHPS